ncbi:MAG: hypothetical protein ACFFD2_19245 [Promethearchaeota archaeon]
MEKQEIYDKYPIRIPILSLSLTISIYSIGTYILAGFGILWAIIYVIYCLLIEIWILKGSCVNCYYYKKTCGLGRGKLCAKLFKKGDPRKFIEAEISWKIILPDFLTLIVPGIGASILLIFNFNLLLLIMLIILILLFFFGNAMIRGKLTCNHCRQRELGCPAAKLFMNKEE